MHLTGAVTGVKRNTVRCGEEAGQYGVRRYDEASLSKQPHAAPEGGPICTADPRTIPPNHSNRAAHLVVALARVEGVLKQAVQDAANAKRRLNHAGREVPAGGRRAVRGWLGNTDATHC